MARLIFGCGYLGGRVGRRWLAEGQTVYVVTRTPGRAEELRTEGFDPIVADIVQRNALPDLTECEIDVVLFAVGFDRSAKQSIEDVYVDGLAHALEQLPDSIRRFIYVSSTGVYGQTDGEWVDEDSDCLPASAGGVACLKAEELLRSSRVQDKAVVLRLAGIYGPGRVPRQAALLAGDPIASSRDGFLNLIHVDDAAAVVVATGEAPAPPTVLLVADGHPVIREQYFRAVAEWIGAPAVQFVEPPPDAPRAARAASNKRVSNRRLEKKLGLKLEYPSYLEGLRMILGDPASG